MCEIWGAVSDGAKVVTVKKNDASVLPINSLRVVTSPWHSHREPVCSGSPCRPELERGSERSETIRVLKNAARIVG